MRSVLLLTCLCVSMTLAKNAPMWPETYITQGVIVIPFAEIEEPFTAFFNGKAKKSRVDYYGGMDKTFQRADQGQFGVAYKLVPMSDEVHLNQINCFIVNGTDKESAIGVQTVLPELDGFKFKGTDILFGQDCEKWQLKEVVGQKVNKYTIWLKRVKSKLNPKLGLAIPIHYEMKGYNNLLGSHYDHYYITYNQFTPDPPQDSIFDEYKNQGECHGWPGPGHTHVYVMNPMKEFVQGHNEHVDSAFKDFTITHSKVYRTNRDHETRKDIFRHNMRYIHSQNRKGLTYKLASNHMADFTSEELKRTRGRLYTPGHHGGKEFKYTPEEVRDAPDELDWRLHGAVTPVKDQSICGSCWSFGTVGTLEGALFFTTGKLIRLSQQALIDCSWGFGNNGCDGGEDFRVYQYMMKHGGIPSEDDYGPYLGQDGFCHTNGTENVFQIQGYVNVTSGDLSALKVALASHGPISVGIDASHKSLSFYSSGVYFEPMCNNSPDGLDHAVLAVGYGTLGGEKYWLIKNSWSTHWGSDGYVLMSQRENNCGVATSPTFVIPKPVKESDSQP